MWSDSDGERELHPNEAPMGRTSNCSQVVVIEEGGAASDNIPTISQLNVSNKSTVHVGPKFVAVTQHVQNAEMVQTRFLGLELISAKNTLRCSIAVFVCWAFVIAIGLALYVFEYMLVKQETRLDLGIKEAWYLRRDDWQARKPYAVNFLKPPISNVLIGHSATEYCDQRYPCIQQVLSIQNDHLKRTWDDIGPNYLVSGNGLVFEGRGANVIGAMVRWWNARSITIMFLGDYSVNKTQLAQFDHVNILLEELVMLKVLVKDYVLYGHCQVSPFTISPDLSLPCYIWAILKSTSRVERLWCAVALACLALGIAMIVYFTKYAKTDVADADIAPHEWNITREMWLAQPYLTEENSTAFEPLRLVVIQHTVGQECFKFIVCAAELRNLQSWFLKDKKYDIPYNFMIGNDGRVYEGRGWEKVGAHTKFFNRCALGIGFTGDYREEMPRHATVTEQQLNRTNALLEYGVQRGFLHPQYQVLGAKDVSDTVSPGSNLYNAIRKWEHFYDGHHYRNKSCEQVYAEFNDG